MKAALQAVQQNCAFARTSVADVSERLGTEANGLSNLVSTLEDQLMGDVAAACEYIGAAQESASIVLADNVSSGPEIQGACVAANEQTESIMTTLRGAVEALKQSVAQIAALKESHGDPAVDHLNVAEAAAESAVASLPNI
jgi:hypothetical protein